MITGVRNLTITGAGKGSTAIVTEPRYANVLSFEDCVGVTVSDLTAGHTAAPGECSGGVLMFYGCHDVSVLRCGLFGCGTFGVCGTNSAYLSVSACEIYSCSYCAIELESCYGTVLSDNDIHDCAYPTLMLYDCTDTMLDGTSLSYATGSVDLPGTGPYRKAS